MRPGPEGGSSISTSKYRIRVHATAAEIDAGAWDRLLQAQAQPTPFMRHAYLLALEASGSATTESGWQAAWISLEEGGRLRAACMLYLKTHSWGEYVFDWGWADAYRRHGLAYYPKALVAVPFTPVPGSRLLAEDEAWRERLVQAITAFVREAGLSSAHALFVDDVDRAAFARAGWMIRTGLQFHWQQDAAQPVADFDELLQRMQRDKRKKIGQERRRVAEAAVRFSVHEGAAIDTRLWDFFHHCHTLTYRAHGGRPYLTRDFFARMARAMPQHWVLFLAQRGNAPLACSLVAVDHERKAAWGRYWGATEFVPCLHFEACYYQPLQWCIAHGFTRFEGGAQGVHKMARGLLPAATASAHLVADARFAQAIELALRQEQQSLSLYVDELHEHSPFRGAPGSRSRGA
ncbi:MAG TPA: peptidogalycan biosysnthesis protein [Rubrivivax sp.]|nr:GNAT family N-acetyltransferase [Burkholderiales bacterium]HNT39687.1 peptidogalycan biosysnthesis protein [Rubrivivax sp.]